MRTLLFILLITFFALGELYIDCDKKVAGLRSVYASLTVEKQQEFLMSTTKRFMEQFPFIPQQQVTEFMGKLFLSKETEDQVCELYNHLFDEVLLNNGIWDKIKCFANCLKSSVPLERLLQVVLKCKKDVECYKKELGEEAMKCVGQCLFDKTEVTFEPQPPVETPETPVEYNVEKPISAEITPIDEEPVMKFETEEAPTEETQPQREELVDIKNIWDKAKCIFKCLKDSVPLDKLIRIVLKCQKDLRCYKHELGEDAMRCVSQCLNLKVEEQVEENVSPLSERTLLEKNELRNLWERVKCMFTCLKNTIPLEKIIQVILKCKTDIQCYQQELGEEAMRCAGQCLKKYNVSAGKKYKVSAKKQEIKSIYNKVVCLFDCLRRRFPLNKLAEVVCRCKLDVGCYLRELGEGARVCVNQCIKEDKCKKLASTKIYSHENCEECERYRMQKIRNIWEKVKCMFTCLKQQFPLEKIVQTILKCKDSIECYKSELGEPAAECARKCLANVEPSVFVAPESNSDAAAPAEIEPVLEAEIKKNPFKELKSVYNKAQCIFKCLKGKFPLQKIIQVVLKCNTNIACYATELGPEVVDCVKQCL